jgi:NAD(P)-dependent dehydrogenase (short-subunit alcohol dehydrogenase family)
MIDLTGRTALVTGAGRNVGAGIAATLARCGAAVAINDLFAERADAVAAELRDAGASSCAVPADVTDNAAVEAMVQAVADQLGPIDILVNNAGVPTEGAPAVRFRDMPMADWDRYIDLNLKAVLSCTRAVLDSMCDRGWGRVVTITSEAGRMGQPPGLSLYAAAKAGANGFTRVLAREVGRFGVTANCVSLGPMDNAPMRDEVLRAMPMRRYGSPDDVGAAVAYLASDGAGWVTGQTLPVNGGYFTT